MKWVRSNGLELTVRDVSPPIYKMTPRGTYPLPIKDEVMDDDAARRFCADLKEKGYPGTKL